MSLVLPRRGLAVIASAALTLGLVAATPPAADAATTLHAFAGAAYGSVVKVGDVRSGKTAYITLCSTSTSEDKGSNAAAVTLDGQGTLDSLGDVGVATTSLKTKQSGSTYSTVAKTTIANASLLGGLVTVDAITSNASASQTNSTYTTTGSVHLVNLKVAGVAVPLSLDPAPNTTVPIPGVGELILNQQTSSTSFGTHAIVVNAVRINIEANILGLTQGYVVLGDANAQLRDTVHLPYGGAYGTQLDVAGLVSAGPTAQVTIPCGGSGGEKRTSSLASLDVPGILGNGLARTSAVSTETSSTAVVTTKAIVDDVSLLGGVVTVGGVTSKATATLAKGKVTGSSAGSSLVDLKINGQSVVIGTGENQKINIAGVGTLTLNAVERKSTSIKVSAIELKLSTAIAGLAKDTVLSVAVAKSGVHV